MNAIFCVALRSYPYKIMNADIITLENQIQMDERQSRYFFINNMGLNSF